MVTLKKIVVGALALSTVAVGASALAERDSQHSNRMVERISSKLDLDDNQDAALQVFVGQLMETRELMRGSDTTTKAAFSELLSSDTFDQGKALTMINDRAATLQERAPEIVASAAVFFDGLTAEQKAQIQKFAEKGRHRHHRNR